MTDEQLTQEDLDQIAADAAKKAVEAALAQQRYGEPAAAGGGTPMPRTPQPGSAEAAEAFVLGRLRDGGGLQDSQGKIQLSRWIPARLREAAWAAVNDPSYRSFSRPGTLEDRKIADERAARRKQR